jgi:hypothetical protein
VLLWIVTGAALLVAAAGWVRARSLKRQIDQITRNYWELRYQFGELRAKVARLDPETPPPAEPAPASPTESFVPLSSLKR